MVSKDDDIKVFHLDLPARTEDIARLELGSAVYLNGLVTRRARASTRRCWTKGWRRRWTCARSAT